MRALLGRYGPPIIDGAALTEAGRFLRGARHQFLWANLERLSEALDVRKVESGSARHPLVPVRIAAPGHPGQVTPTQPPVS